jgi:hypothetical protein
MQPLARLEEDPKSGAILVHFYLFLSPNGKMKVQIFESEPDMAGKKGFDNIRSENNPFGIGLYFLSNDNVLDQTIAFLNSIRRWATDIPMSCIPFDDNLSKLLAISEKYNFKVLVERQCAKWDEIGRLIYPDHENYHKLFRKFECFIGPYQRFLFLDTDIVVLNDLTNLLDIIETGKASIYFGDHNNDEVFIDGPLKKAVLAHEGANMLNTGFWSGRRGLFSYDEVWKMAKDLDSQQRMQFCEATMEQPFLNYCLYIKGLQTRQFKEAIPDLSGVHWAKNNLVSKNGFFYADDEMIKNPNTLPLSLIHWAGCGSGYGTPNYNLFLHYRLSDEPLWSRLRYKLINLSRYYWKKLYRLGIRTKLKHQVLKVIMPNEKCPGQKIN